MNLFEAEHPLANERPSRHRKKRHFLKRFAVVLVIYLVYLLCLGPLYALNDRGSFEYIPVRLREAFILPAAPFMLTPGLRNNFDNYLNWWFEDPNAIPRETGW